MTTVAPKAFLSYGRLEYIGDWNGMRVWHGHDIISGSFWTLCGDDILVSPKCAANIAGEIERPKEP